MLNIQVTATTFFRQALLITALVGVTVPVSAVQAAAQGGNTGAAKATRDLSAHGLIRQVTVEMLDVLKNDNPEDVGQEAFQRKVLAILEPVVDFDFIARSVMGGYASQATDEQKAQFAEVFKKGLISTYSKGVSGFANKEIETLPPEGDIGGQRRVSVDQKIESPDGVDHLSYTMAMNREGQWKLINMVMNGVNLGKTFRNQFAQAMAQNKGDLDTVISNWGKTG